MAAGAEEGNQVAKLTLSTLKFLKPFADFEAKQMSPENHPKDKPVSPSTSAGQLPPKTNPVGNLGLNLSYTINLNLPATSDQAVFNAIFRSLKEHLLSNNE